MTSMATELHVRFSTCSVWPVGMRILLGEGNSWTPAACTPTQAQDPGQNLNRGSFFTFIPTILWKYRVQNSRFPFRSTMMGRQSFIFRRGWWGPLGDGLLWVMVSSEWIFLPSRTQGDPEKGPAAVSLTEKGAGWLCHQAPGGFSCHGIVSLLVPLGPWLRPDAKYHSMQWTHKAPR